MAAGQLPVEWTGLIAGHAPGLLLALPAARFLVKLAGVGWITTGVRNAHVKVRVTVHGGPFTVVVGEDVAVAQTQPSLPVERPRLPAPVEPPEEPRPETR